MLIHLVLLIVRSGIMLLSKGSIHDLSQQRRVLLLDYRGNISEPRLAHIHVELGKFEFIGNKLFYTVLISLLKKALVKLNDFVLNTLLEDQMSTAICSTKSKNIFVTKKMD